MLNQKTMEIRTLDKIQREGTLTWEIGGERNDEQKEISDYGRFTVHSVDLMPDLWHSVFRIKNGYGFGREKYRRI